MYRASRNRWRAMLLIAALFVSTLLIASVWYYREPQLNLVLLTLDTTRADRLGVYGYQEGLTAAFDKYAQGGVVFERAYAPAPITLPSHSTMLTGLYPPEHGLRVNGEGRLASEIPLLPQILKKHGYDTGAFLSAVVLNSQFGLDRGFNLYDDCSSDKSQSVSQQRRAGQTVIDRALLWLSGRSKRPFFCWIHLFDAHGPYRTREETFGDRFKNVPYDAGIAEELRQVERVFTFLKERQLERNTVVIIAGDHGEGLGDHREAEHGMLVYNTTLQVPLVFAGTQHCRPGTRVSTTVSLVDITPTALDLLGIRAAHPMSGRSLKAALQGNEITPRAIYAEAETPFVSNHWCPLRVVISERWKYIQTTRPELYDLNLDPSEHKNLFDSEALQRKEMQNILELTQESFKVVTPQKLQLSEKEQSDLIALGYVGIRKTGSETKSANQKVLKDIKDMLSALEDFDRAKELALKGEFGEAIVLLRGITSQDDESDFFDAWALLADCFVGEDRLDEAAAVFRQLISNNPRLAKLHFRLGTTLARQGKFVTAMEELHIVLKLEPTSASAHLELAKILTRLHKFEDAIKEYQEAIRIAPDTPFAYLELGQTLLMLKRVKEAAVCLEKAVRVDPRDAIAQALLLSALVQMGDNEKALAYGKKAVEVDPESFEARYNLGVFLISRNRIREGIEQLREAQKRHPDDPRPMQQIQQAEAALKRGR